MITLILLALFAVLYALVIVYSFSLSIRRWHDLGYSGWMSLLTLIPLVNLVTAIILLFVRGDEGANAYGPSNVGQPFWKSVFAPSSLMPVTPAVPVAPVASMAPVAPEVVPPTTEQH